jgi:hypothetical protein
LVELDPRALGAAVDARPWCYSIVLEKPVRITAGPSVASKLIGRARGPVERALSAREIEVLTLHIFAKLGVDDRTAAITVAMERGILRLKEKLN